MSISTHTSAPVFTSPGEMSGQLVSYTMRMPYRIDSLDVLRRTHGQRRFLWEHMVRGGLHTLIGYGVAVELTAGGLGRFDDMRALAKQLYATARVSGDVEATRTGAPPLMGGFSFRDDFVPQVVWQGMYAAHFVVPAVLLVQSGESGLFYVNRYVPAEENAEAARAELAEEAETIYDDLFWNTPDPAWDPEWEEASSIEYPMAYDDWAQMIRTATGKMQRDELDKVVLARMAQVRFNKPVNVVRALAYLREHYGNTYRFLFEPEPHNAFYGATPETLIAWEHDQPDRIYADALAGTIKRGATPEEDTALAQQILNDAKERREHDYVVQGLRERLSPFVQDVEADGTPGLMKLSNVQHLHTPVYGTLKGETDIFSLLQALHPTPALGGMPREVAGDLIKALEPIPRGWYAAPIGWVTYDLRGKFGVGIRSAVSRDGTLWAYAGAGIVAESVPEREWRETELKFRPMLNAVGIQA